MEFESPQPFFMKEVDEEIGGSFFIVTSEEISEVLKETSSTTHHGL